MPAAASAQEYLAVSPNGRVIGGPYKYHSEAKKVADEQRGYVQFVESVVPRKRAAASRAHKKERPVVRLEERAGVEIDEGTILRASDLKVGDLVTLAGGTRRRAIQSARREGHLISIVIEGKGTWHLKPSDTVRVFAGHAPYVGASTRKRNCAHKHPPEVPSMPCASTRATAYGRRRRFYPREPDPREAQWKAEYAKYTALRQEKTGGRPGITAEDLWHQGYAAPSREGEILLYQLQDPRHSNETAALLYEYPGWGFGESSGITGYYWPNEGVLRKRAGKASAARENPLAAAAGPFATVERDPADLKAGKKFGTIANARSVHDILYPQLSKETGEVFLVLPLDLHGEMLCAPVEIARGQRDRVQVDMADVLRPLVVTNAMGAVVVHNHPSSHAGPSQSDRALTKQIREAISVALPEVVFVDHVIISGKGGEFYSFTDAKLHHTGKR